MSEKTLVIYLMGVIAVLRKVDNQLVNVTPRGLEVAADFGHLRSPENYLGYERAETFVGDAVQDTRHSYSTPQRLALNQWGLAGNWIVKAKGAELNEPNGRIVFRFHSRDVNLIMGPPRGGKPVRFNVRVDHQPPGVAHGTDIDEQGDGTADRQRTYQLVREPKSITDREFEIQFLESGVEAFCFTFG